MIGEQVMHNAKGPISPETRPFIIVNCVFLTGLVRQGLSAAGQPLAAGKQEVDPGTYARVVLILAREDDVDTGVEIR